MGGNKKRTRRRHVPESVTLAGDPSKKLIEKRLARKVLPEFESAISELGRRRESSRQPLEIAVDSFAATAADAWHASYGTHVSRALMQRSAADFLAEVVIGEDDRIRIRDTIEYPYSAICSLEITASNGRHFVGTGWLVDERTVVTAGHCVYLAEQGGWARRIEVYPGRNGHEGRVPIRAVRLHSNRGWTRDRRRSADYGAITIDEPIPDYGSFGYVTLKDSDLMSQVYHVVGYSADKPSGTLWGHLRPLAEVRKNTLIYETDTYGGNSGCPVFYLDRNDVYAVGIHNYGDLSGNVATRITEEVFDNIQGWADS